jgi:hypothetical protein
MDSVGAVADAAKVAIDAGEKIVARHDHHLADVDAAADAVRAPLQDPSPLPTSAAVNLCPFCQEGDHQYHFNTGCDRPVPAIESDCQCKVVTEQESLLVNYEARLAATTKTRGVIQSTLSALEALEVNYTNAIAKRPDSAAKAELFALWLDEFRAATKPTLDVLKDAR